MERRGVFLAACSLLVVACADAEDDSWNGAAGDRIHESEGGNGGQASNGGSPSANGGNHSTDGGAPSETGPGPTTVTSGPTTTTTGGGSCDIGSCDSCQGCAMNGPCAASIDACFNDTECYALIECMNPCVDDACLQACASSHPSAMPLYNAVGECIYCDACPSTCGGC
ncbi:MAG: hypothetical protein JNK04_23480 [Myxococcales bacterium]|nr:hypothetical protein [Myxococcales bacterium]